MIGTANDGVEALAFIKKQKPDVITMDIYMPRVDGLEATRRIMSVNPIPIVVVSMSIDSEVAGTTFMSLDAGAVAALPRPSGTDKASVEKFIETVKSMACVKLVRRQPSRACPSKATGAGPANETPSTGTPFGGTVSVIGIGSSAGGPPVVRDILFGLRSHLNVPVLVVQHIDNAFAEGFAQWLSDETKLHVHIASNGLHMLPGHVYIPPGDFHMGVETEGFLKVRQDPHESHLRPSVAFLFRSLAQVYGPRAVGLLLTGMGADGAAELKLMRDRGAMTMAQDEESSLVFGMPGEAVKLGAARHVLPPAAIITMLTGLMEIERGSRR